MLSTLNIANQINIKSKFLKFLIKEYIGCDFWFPLPLKFLPFFIKLKLFNYCIIEDRPSFLVYSLVVDVVTVLYIFTQVADHPYKGVL